MNDHVIIVVLGVEQNDHGERMVVTIYHGKERVEVRWRGELIGEMKVFVSLGFCPGSGRQQEPLGGPLGGRNGLAYLAQTTKLTLLLGGELLETMAKPFVI